MIQVQNRTIFIQGKPTLLLSGEIHYFRLKQSMWQKAIDELKNCGCNTVATYIPWICHEYREGEFDLNGKYREEHDLMSFLELCKTNGLFIIARPGPFIMAEIKNEGIPYWVYEKYPDVIPITWEGKPVASATTDYLHPDFLACSKRWYENVMPLLAGHLPQNGGTLIAVQLDNEIGMLSWCTNSPDLTDFNLSLFIDWLTVEYGSALSQRYGYPLSKNEETFSKIRMPKEEVSLLFHADYGKFSRERYSRYVKSLRRYAKDAGIEGIPFFVNIHGSGGNRGTGYPIGISQLFETYRGSDDIYSGSDFYIGDINISNFQDIFLANAFTDCMNAPNQPLASLEFEAGDGDYSNDFSNRNSPHAINIKTRTFIAQGNRLLNYYLFAGGENYRFDDKHGDGNDRIAFTGGTHGFAAPLGPGLSRGTTYDMNRDVVSLMKANAPYLANMTLETDNVTFAFIPDYYMTEYCNPNSRQETEMIEEIRRVRDVSAYNLLARSLVLTNRNFQALDIQHHDISESLSPDTVLAIASCFYMPIEIQKNICRFLDSGGSLFLVGRIPAYDLEGSPCTILADKLGAWHQEIICEGHRYYASVYPCGVAEGYPETRSPSIQTVTAKDADVFLRAYPDGGACGFTKLIGRSKVVCILCDYQMKMPLMETLFDFAGIRKRFTHNAPHYGLILMPTSNEKDERFVHILNLDDFEKTFTLNENSNTLFAQTITTGPKQCLMLPRNITVLPDVTIVESTAELLAASDKTVTFRLTQPEDIIVIKTDTDSKPSHTPSKSSREGNVITFHFKQGVIESKQVTLEFCHQTS